MNIGSQTPKQTSFEQDVYKAMSSGIDVAILETYKALLETTTVTEKFSNWLLVSAGAGVAPPPPPAAYE